METKTQQTQTLTLNDQQIAQLEMDYHQCRQPNKAYMQAWYKFKDGSIIVYTSKKTVFQGSTALLIAGGLNLQTDFVAHAGSDEVGSGDYFGPLVVCATYVDKQHFSMLQTMRIKDTKQTDDQAIVKQAQVLKQTIPYSVLVLENQKYNQVHQTRNLNAIKAQMHQRCYFHLYQKIGHVPPLSVVDQFAPKPQYYRYLEDDYGITQLTFETKAENKYFAVACAAIIARDAFLTALNQLDAHYQTRFPKGSGAQVDAFGLEFIKKHGPDELMRVSKLHFKNTEKILELFRSQG